MDFDRLRSDIVQMLGGGCAKINMRSFQNDMRNFRTKDDVLTLLIHLGYLAYDSREEKAFIPNKEIIGEFENAMSTGGWTEIVRILKASEQLLKDTLSGDARSVAEGLNRAHTAIQQIKDRQYTQAFEGYAGEILAVGINYERNNVNKPHSCVIERMKK